MRKLVRISLSLLVGASIIACDDCDDCLDLQQKNVLVQDSNGNNLLFGPSAIYDREELKITSNGGEVRSLFSEEATQTVLFSLLEGETNYTLELNETTTVTLGFELGMRESQRCCGDQLYSTATTLNGATVENADTIIIVL